VKYPSYDEVIAASRAGLPHRRLMREYVEYDHLHDVVVTPGMELAIESPTGLPVVRMRMRWRWKDRRWTLLDPGPDLYERLVREAADDTGG
jgi:hypothetical protein